MPAREPVIFINYRGGIADWGPDFVHRELTAAFGTEAVFKAGQTLRPGEEFPRTLETRAASCPIMLVCIGPGWLTAQNPDGTRRLDDVHDWVRREIGLALHNGNHVVPLLLGNISEVCLPLKKDLAEDIAPLVERHAERLEPGSRYPSLVRDLVEKLAALAPDLPRRTPDAGGAPASIQVQIGIASGMVTAVRTRAGIPQRIDADLRIDEVTETGEVTGLDLLP